MLKGIVFLIALLLTACQASMGTRELSLDRLAYNETLQYSTMQQNLLNIVRLRYNDPPYFLSVNSIVSQFVYTKSMQSNGALNNNYLGSPMAYVIPSVTPSLSLEDRPTITFTPLQGTEFVTRLMTPVDLSVVYMMLRAGWGFSHVFRPIVDQIGSIHGAKTASRPTSSRVPEYREMLILTNAFRKLQAARSLEFTALEEEKKFALKLVVTNFSVLNTKEKLVLRKISITPEEPYVTLVRHPSQEPHEVYVQTRTVLGIFNYFSKGVDVPDIDIEKHRVPMTYYPDGRMFDWRLITGKLFKVKVSAQRPKFKTMVMVKYRNYYFYIDDNDFESKESFILMTILMGIYEGKIQEFLPLFTVS